MSCSLFFILARFLSVTVCFCCLIALFLFDLSWMSSGVNKAGRGDTYTDLELLSREEKLETECLEDRKGCGDVGFAALFFGFVIL